MAIPMVSLTLIMTIAAAATLPLNAAYVSQPLMRSSPRATGAFGIGGLGLSRRHPHSRQQQTTRATVLSDSTTMDFEMNLNLPGIVNGATAAANGAGAGSLTGTKSLQVEGIAEDGGQGSHAENTMFDDLMRASAQRRRGGRDAEDAPPGAVVNLTDMPDLLSLELPTSNDGKTVMLSKPKGSEMKTTTHQMKDAVTQAALAADDNDDVSASAATDNDSGEEAPKKKKKVTATIRETGQDSMKHYLKSMGNHDLLNKNEEIILAREIQILIGWEETRVDLEAKLAR